MNPATRIRAFAPFRGHVVPPEPALPPQHAPSAPPDVPPMGDPVPAPQPKPEPEHPGPPAPTPAPPGHPR
jgi:preprotein translocase subunit SecD